MPGGRDLKKLPVTLTVDPEGSDKQEVMARQTLSIMKACEMVGVSRRTIYNWISAGKLEYVRTAGGSIRIFADSLWRDGNKAPAPAEPGSGAETASPTDAAVAGDRHEESSAPAPTTHSSTHP